MMLPDKFIHIGEPINLSQANQENPFAQPEHRIFLTGYLAVVLGAYNAEGQRAEPEKIRRFGNMVKSFAEDPQGFKVLAVKSKRANGIAITQTVGDQTLIIVITREKYMSSDGTGKSEKAFEKLRVEFGTPTTRRPYNFHPVFLPVVSRLNPVGNKEAVSSGFAIKKASGSERIHPLQKKSRLRNFSREVFAKISTIVDEAHNDLPAVAA